MKRKAKELLASDYMTYYIFQRIYNKGTITTEYMDTERFAKKLDILEKLNLTYNKLYLSYRDIITDITTTTFGKLKELRFIGETYKAYNILCNEELNNLVYAVQKALETIRIERVRAIGTYLDKCLLTDALLDTGYMDLILTDLLLEVILKGIELVEYICNSHLKELHEKLPCKQVQDILEKGYMRILLEALDN